jgi:predicted metal-binding membrane protein
MLAPATAMPPVSGDFFKLLANNQRSVMLASMLGLTLFSWWYLLDMDMMAMMISGVWVPSDWLAMYLMWAIMMVAMMLPSAAPMILMYGLISPRRQPLTNHLMASYVFMLGYLLAWAAFSGLATIAQWQLQQYALLTPMLESRSLLFSSILLLAAGVYQWAPVKDSCLQQCRSPVEHLTRHWLPGLAGALRMGFYHGMFCLGCCWLLMLLLFAGGVMNLVLIAALAIFVVLEKVLPARWPVSGLSGALLIVAGIGSLVQYWV